MAQLREGRGAVPSQGDVIFVVFAARSQCSWTLSDPDSSLVRMVQLTANAFAALPPYGHV